MKLPSKAVESYTGAGPIAKSGAAVNYGPYEGVPPFAGGTLGVHFESNGPFIEALSCVREVQVSHWGNVYVEEWYTIRHTGAIQKVPVSCLHGALPVSGELPGTLWACCCGVAGYGEEGGRLLLRPRCHGCPPGQWSGEPSIDCCLVRISGC